MGLAGPYDFLTFTEGYLNDLFGPPDRFPRSQPINYASADAPPLLLMCGLRDKWVDPVNTRRLAAAVKSVDGPVTARYFDTADHADLVVAFSILERQWRPVLWEIQHFIAAERGPRREADVAAETKRTNDGKRDKQ